MKHLLNKIKTVISNRPQNSILLLSTGFFFTQFMLVNILYIKHPLGGWVTSVGTFSTASILIASLVLLSVCLFSLWRSVAKNDTSAEDLMNNTVPMLKVRNSFSPIDYPQGSTLAVVPGYAYN